MPNLAADCVSGLACRPTAEAMTDLFPLQVFPEGALASSVVTTVLVGVLVVGFLNLRLGWVLSGLVVPGYMVPLLLDKPVAAAVVFAEGILTYAVVWFYSEVLTRRAGWSNFFGRDRFFALVLVSVGVRVVLDGWALPIFGEGLNTRFQLAFDYRNNLHSFGLIVVSLIANNFWKSGLRRGLLPMAVTIGITYAIVRYIFIEYTNFNINSLGYAYEDIAASLLASPKAYIILLTTAFIASRMNLLYGWDFAGILIPSLLALQWYQPEKILMSFVEAAVVLVIALGVLKLPYFRGKTIEGARKLMLFFSISYAYKYVLAYALLAWAPEQKITDYYGFGYLLPTLIAIKMHGLGVMSRLIRATVQTSLVAGLLATVFGFALYFVPDSWSMNTPPTAAGTALQDYPGRLIHLVREEQVALYNTRQVDSMGTPLGGELEAWREGLRLLRDAPPSDREAINRAAAMLDRANYEVLHVEQRYLALRERAPRRHWGFYVIDPAADGHLLLEVPAPLDERGSLDAGLGLFRQFSGRALAVAGAARSANKDGSADPLLNPRTPFLVFHQVFAHQDVLQIRTFQAESARVLGGLRPGGDATALASQLWIKRQLPESLDLAALRAVAGEITLHWGSTPLPNIPRETVHAGFAELVLGGETLRVLIANALRDADPVRVAEQDISIEGYLQDLLLSRQAALAEPGSEAFRAAGVADLLYFDGEIMLPLQRAAARHYREGRWSEAGIEELTRVQSSAATFGYELIRYRHRATQSDYLVLRERDDPARRRYWGTYVLRLGPAAPVIVQVPRPGYEVNSLEFGVSLFESARARALLIGGAHPNANTDQSADLLRIQYRGNLFNTINQSVLREFGEQAGLVAQVRSLGIRRDLPPPPSDVVLAAASGARDDMQLSALGRSLRQHVAQLGLSSSFAGDRPETAGLEAGSLPQAAYLAATQNKDLLSLWVSPLARAAYRQQTDPSPQEQQFRALGVSSTQADLFAHLAALPLAGGLPENLRAALERYIANPDIVVLAGARQRHPTLHLERVVDLNSRQGFLVVSDGRRGLLAVANLTARDPTSSVTLPAAERRAAIAQFVDRRAAWLLPVPGDAR